MPAFRAATLRIGIDLPSLPLNPIGRDEASFIWPTPYSEYLSFAHAATRNLVEMFSANSLPETVRAAGASILGDVAVDAERVAKAALDLHFARRQNIELAFGPKSSPIHAFIASSSALPASKLGWSDFFPPVSKPLSLVEKLKSRAAYGFTFASMRLTPAAGRADQQNHAPLLSEYLQACDIKPLLLRAERWTLRRTAKIAPEIFELVRGAGSVLENLLHDRAGDAALVARARFVFEGLILGRLKSAYSDAAELENIKLLEQAGDILLGGTSNEVGRLLNWLYRKRGKQVWRFSHGGDRAFFVDPIWSVTEFPYVDRYYVFGAGEARQLAARYADRRELVPFSGPPQFASFGSIRHQNWWRLGQARLRTRRPREKCKIILCCGSFLGEAIMVSLTFKPPDPLIADTMSHVIGILVRSGFDVSVKPHPKGLPFGEHFHLGVQTIDGAFDPIQIDADCYVFDFAGSAFFDALASEKGVLLIDTSARQWDDNGLDDLKARCEVIKAQPDEFNRMRVDESELIGAVERAIQRRECPEWFARKYFFPEDKLLDTSTRPLSMSTPAQVEHRRNE